MNRTQTACFALLASAFVLAAILLVRVDQKSSENAAVADGQVVVEPQFSLMTARTLGAGDESLFILDNSSGNLIIYYPNVSRKQLEPVFTENMRNLFGGQ